MSTKNSNRVTPKGQPERVFLAQFTIDPNTEEFHRLKAVCDPGNPWRCLIAQKGRIELGKRMSVRLDNETLTGVIGITHGDYRYERPMTQQEVAFAAKFDRKEELRRPLTVRIDLGDGTWTAIPKYKTGRNYGTGSGRILRSRRSAQLEAIRRDAAVRQAAELAAKKTAK